MSYKPEFKVLIVDDHPLIIDAYKSGLQRTFAIKNKYELSIDIAQDCDSAIKKIEHSVRNEAYELIVLDINIPMSEDGKYLSGEDVGVRVNEVLPQTKILVSTTHNDPYRLLSIFKSVNPDGFIIKNDIDPRELVRAINGVVVSPPYYSHTVMNVIRNEMSNDKILDAIDRKILHELSLGTKMSELPEVILMSLPGLEKRKRQIKEIFNIANASDRRMLEMARDKGFI